MSGPRLLIVEFLNSDRFCQYRSEMLPYVQAYAHENGLPMRWVCFGFDPRALPTSPLFMALSEGDTETLLDIVAEHRPTHVLLNEALDEPLDSHVRRAAGEATVDVVTALGTTWPEVWYRRDLERWLGRSDVDPDDPTLLVDVLEPDYDCELCNDLAREIKPFVPVIAGTPCIYRPSICSNPNFADIDLSDASRQTGCTFCTGGEDTRYFTGRTSPVERALAQVRRARATIPRARNDGQYSIVGVNVVLQIQRFFAAILAGDFPPSEFFFWSRIDELYSRAGAIEALLPKLRERGHVLSFWNVGVENFSPEENERFNKGITNEQFDETFACIDRWEREFPETFRFHVWGGFGFILFTPWSRISDIRRNLEMAEERGVQKGSIFFISRLQLFDKLPVKLLADRDGLTAGEFDDPIFRHFCAFVATTSADQQEVPWRFRDPVLAAVYGVFIRLDVPWKQDLFDGDGDFRRVTHMLRGGLPPEYADVFSFLHLVLDVAEANPRVRTAGELLDCVEGAVEIAPPGSVPVANGAPVATSPEQFRLTLRDTVRGLMARLENDRQQRLRGYCCVGVECADGDGWGQVEVTLERGSDRLRFYLVPAAATETAFFATRHFAVMHDSATPADTRHKAWILRTICAALERRVMARAAS